MKKKFFMAFCLAMLAHSVSAQTVLSDSQDAATSTLTEVVDQTPQKQAAKKKLYTAVGFAYHRFNTKANLYGLNLTFMRTGGFAGEIAYNSDFKEHSTHKLDLGLNYTFRLYDNDEFRCFLVPSLGPVFRISDVYKRTDVTTKTTYSNTFGYQTREYKKDIYGKEVYLDGYLSVRLLLAYKSVALSGGYYMFSPKFKFTDKALSHGATVSLSYFF